MKFAIASEHRDFFQNHQYIEFANLLNPEQVHRLHEDCKQALVNRLKLTSHFSLEKCPPSDLFSQGRDLWRSLPGIKKALFNPAFAELLGELCHQRLLRIGFDQYFPKKADGLPTVYRTGVYENFLKPTRSLLSFSSIQGLIGGVLICLSGEGEAASSGAFATTPGHGVYLSVDYPIPFSEMPGNYEYLLVTYAIKKSVYISNDQDPLTYALRQWDYSYGDSLKDKSHPIILRG